MITSAAGIVKNFGPSSLTYHTTTPFNANLSDRVVTLARTFSGAIVVNGFDLWPHDNLTSDDTNYTTLRYYWTNLDGTGATTIAQITTQTIGSGGTGDWTNGTRVAFPAGPFAIPAGKLVFFSMRQSASGGVTVPDCDVVAY